MGGAPVRQQRETAVIPRLVPNRRDFLRTGTAAVAGLTAFGASASAAAPEAQPAAARPAAAQPAPGSSPADRIVIGVMGVFGRGSALANGLAEQQGAAVKYVCDVDDQAAGKAADAVAAKGVSRPEAVRDFRRILDDAEVDALVIATPDHWHAPAAILACAAGKHVYVEKPCAHNPREGELLAEAARRHNRVVQHGTQRRSWSKVIEAIQKVRAGEIGRVPLSRGWYANSRGSIGRGQQAPPPGHLDWDLWQGPAPRRPYQGNVVHYNWHWFWHWGTGELGNNGIHALDLCRWGLGVDYPRRVTAGGGRYFFDDDQETPDTLNVTFEFGDEKAIVWEGRSCQPRGIEGSQFGAAFYGDKGTIVIDANDYKVYDVAGQQTATASDSGADAPHLKNFLDSIRTGSRPAADIQEGVKSVLMCHLGNIAYRTGGAVQCDPQTGRILNNRDAEALWGREYQQGWEVRV